MTPSAPPLAARFAAVRYSPPHASKAVLENFSLDITAGEIVVLVGESGSGKTTILRLINGLLMADAGEIRVEGRAMADWDVIELRRRIGYVLQDDGLFPHFTVGQNVALVPQLLGWDKAKIEARVAEMLELVRLEPARFMARFPAQLSGGQRQRVGIARALAADQPILLLDEPFGRLDPITREQLREEFGALCRRLKKTVVFVTHDLREALLLADRIALLSDGSLTFLGSPVEFLASQDAHALAYRKTLEMPAFS